MATKMVLLPAYRSTGSDLPKGSSLTEARCGHLAWISPSGAQMLLRTPGVRPFCEDCVKSEAHKVAGMTIVPGAFQELAETVGFEEAYRAREALRTVDAHLQQRKKKKRKRR